MDVEAFAPLLPALTDEALVAIANKGLLRRAQKDLEQSAPTVITETDGLTLQVAEHQVLLPLAGPTQASCSCPATGTCRHVLVGCLWLRSQLSHPEQPQAHALTTLTYTLQDLITWAGKPTLRKATEFLAKEPTCEIEATEPLVVQFPSASITCRYYGATGLEGMTCSCKARSLCLHRVAAILAQLRRQGTPVEPPEAPSAKKSIETPRSQTEILQTTQKLLRETLNIGLLHLTETTRQRYVTLAVSAQSANFVRLSLSLRSLGDEIERVLTRQASADEIRLFQLMAQTAALCQALQNPQNRQRPDLLGQSRREYQPVGNLELMGMGAYPWQTASGYTGLTLLFWDGQHQQWSTWSEARPDFHQGRWDPFRRYEQPLPWQGEPTAAQASGSHLVLAQAKRNIQGRLSGSAQTHAVLFGPTQISPSTLGHRYFDDWAALQDYLLQRSELGLKVTEPLDLWVVISPTAWGDPAFDELSQTFWYPLWDAQERLLYLEVKHREIDSHRLNTLQNLPFPQESVWGIVGRPYFQAGRLLFFPISLLRETPPTVFNLGFPQQNQKDQTSAPAVEQQFQPSESFEAIEILEEDMEPEESFNTPIQQALEALVSILQHLANSGVQRIKAAQATELTRLSQYFQSTGLTALAQTVDLLMTASENQTEILLNLRYLCLLAQQAISQASLIQA